MNTYTIYTNPAFIRILTGSTASGFATWGFVFLLGLTIVSGELSATQLGIALGTRTVGFLVGVFFGGVMADKLSRRGVIFTSSIVSAIGIIAVMIGLSSEIMVTYLGALLAGLGQGGCRPAYQALVPITVEAGELQSANAAMGLSIRLVTLLGPTMTSGIVLYFGAMPAYVLLLTLWLISAFSPPKIDNNEQMIATKKAQKFSLKIELLGGLDEAKKHPWFLWSLFALTLVIAFGYSASNIILPMISKDTGSVGFMTECITAYTIGGIFGAIFLSKYNFQSIGWVALLGMASYGFAPLSLLFLSLPPTSMSIIWIPLFGYLIAGFGIEVFNVLWFTAIQREVPKSHLARVSSLDFLFSYGLAPLGLAMIAPLTEQFGTNPVLLICGFVSLAMPLTVMRVSSSKKYSTHLK